MNRKIMPSINILAIFLILCGFISSTTSAEENYISLFNGKDLSGWIPMGTPKAFTVKENSIYTTGAGPYPTWLRSEKEYENFVLRFEYRTEGWYEGGVLIHAPLDGPGSKIGLKLHLRHDQKEYGTRSPGAIYDAAAPRKIANLPSKQWNRCEILCNWPRLRISLNGTVIHDIDMESDEVFRYRLRKGFIGIQNIGCKASFRNIQIRPLPGKENWINLFRAGMQGFRTQGEADWHIQNNVITGKGGDGTAITKEEFEGPYELQAWVKTIVNGNGGVLINYGQRGVEVQCFNSPDSTNPTGSLYGIASARRVLSYDEEWFLLQIFNNGPKAMVMVNGERVCETNKLRPPYKGGIAFQQHTPGAVIHYRGARIKMISD